MIELARTISERQMGYEARQKFLELDFFNIFSLVASHGVLGDC
jgi:hypothetical protein